MTGLKIYGFFLSLGLAAIAFAGTNNLPTETGPVIQLSHVNKFKTAFSGDIVPRNSSGTVTNDGGSLGSSTYRFTSGWMDTLKLQKAAGSNAVTLQSPGSLAAAYSCTMPAALPVSGTKFFTLDSSGNFGDAYDVDGSTLEVSSNSVRVKDAGITDAKLATDSVTTAKILAANVTNAKMATDSVGTSNIIAANVTSAKMQTNVDLPGTAVKANSVNVVVSNTNASTNLGIIRGEISGAAALTLGEGWSATVSTGTYTLTWSTSFASAPVVVATPHQLSGTNTGVTVISTSTSGCVIQTIGSPAGANSIYFIAIGPR